MHRVMGGTREADSMDTTEQVSDINGLQAYTHKNIIIEPINGEYDRVRYSMIGGVQHSFR